jgi:hypothetical protein
MKRENSSSVLRKRLPEAMLLLHRALEWALYPLIPLAASAFSHITVAALDSLPDHRCRDLI